jgi:hypothetical protein
MKNQEAQSLAELGLSAEQLATKQAKVDAILHPTGSAIGTLAETGIAPPVTRKPRADKGKPRAVKAAESAPVAGMLTLEQRYRLDDLRKDLQDVIESAVRRDTLSNAAIAKATVDYYACLDSLTAKA